MGYKAFFVDGPIHGQISILEGEPNKEYFTASSTLHTKIDYEEPMLTQMTCLKHRYFLVMKSPRGQHIYLYEGIVN